MSIVFSYQFCGSWLWRPWQIIHPAVLLSCLHLVTRDKGRQERLLSTHRKVLALCGETFHLSGKTKQEAGIPLFLPWSVP